MNNFIHNHEKILETLQSVEPQINFLNQIHKPKLSNIKLANSYLVCTINGVFTDFDLSQASRHDIHYLKDIKYLYQKH